MPKRQLVNEKRKRRQIRTRAKIFGLATKPRLAVFRSSRLIYGQLIDDMNHKTLVSVSSLELKGEDRKKTKTEQAKLVGSILAKRAVDSGIKQAILDRRHYKYHGRVLSLVEAARNAGLDI